jgi:hypothetical protein
MGINKNQMAYMLTMGINPSYPLGPSIGEEPYA